MSVNALVRVLVVTEAVGGKLVEVDALMFDYNVRTITDALR